MDQIQSLVSTNPNLVPELLMLLHSKLSPPAPVAEEDTSVTRLGQYCSSSPIESNYGASTSFRIAYFFKD